MNIKNKILRYFENYESHAPLTLFIFGLYPFFHYYNNNISEATSWQQLLFISLLCFGLPQLLLLIMPYVLKIDFLKPLKRHGLAILCGIVFFGLIGFFMFFPNKKKILLLIIIGSILGWFLSKHLKKIIVIQLILVLISMVSILPKLTFHLQQDNATWATLSDEELQTKLTIRPNIFVIQPDGYVNFSEIDKPPYNFNNSEFKSWLDSKGFTHYNKFRSNYYSTYTSNSSMFAMRHHYYSNTDMVTRKTHKANEAIVGKYNNVLNILRPNDYKNYLIIDNSYFLIDREPMEYDHCNINSDFISYHRSGVLHDVDILKDFNKALDTLTSDRNFFFVEKTIPGHIRHKKSISKGKEEERLLYLEELKKANEWLIALVNKIIEYDDSALIVIVADHGGYVGLEYTMEATERKLDKQEALSSFSSILSIKWPEAIKHDSLTFKSNVNLFRNLFYALSENEQLKDNLKENSSYLPLQVNGNTDVYQYFDDKGNYVFEQVQN